MGRGWASNEEGAPAPPICPYAERFMGETSGGAPGLCIVSFSGIVQAHEFPLLLLRNQGQNIQLPTQRRTRSTGTNRGSYQKLRQKCQIVQFFFVALKCCKAQQSGSSYINVYGIYRVYVTQMENRNVEETKKSYRYVYWPAPPDPPRRRRRKTMRTGGDPTEEHLR